jgi:hypothetical protein
MISLEVCLGDCSGRLLFNAADPLTREKPKPWIEEDEDGWLLCGFCNRYVNTMNQLTTCPDCEAIYKGYKRYPKYHWPCPDCE